MLELFAIDEQSGELLPERLQQLKEGKIQPAECRLRDLNPLFSTVSHETITTWMSQDVYSIPSRCMLTGTLSMHQRYPIRQPVS